MELHAEQLVGFDNGGERYRVRRRGNGFGGHLGRVRMREVGLGSGGDAGEQP